MGMTVKELIEWLQKLPNDTKIGVVFSAYSELQILEEGMLKYHPPGSNYSRYGGNVSFILRQGKLMTYDPRTWDSAEGEPQFIGVVEFPGN